eukprot:13377746-Alexandrium_andersonii.AAC.1
MTDSASGQQTSVAAKIRFRVFDIKRPLVSTTLLKRHGFKTVFGDLEGDYIAKDGLRVELYERQEQPYFDAEVIRQADCYEVMAANEEDEKTLGDEVFTGDA